MNEIDIAYVAGILDGEGCIGIQKYNNCRAFRTIITVVQRDPAIIEWLYSKFGGSVNIVPRIRKEIITRFYLRWVITDKKAYELLTSCLPYLKLKKEQAKLSIRLFELKQELPRYGTYFRYTEEAIEEMTMLFLKNKNLNSPATTERDGSLNKEMRQSELTEMKNRQSAIRSEAPLIKIS